MLCQWCSSHAVPPAAVLLHQQKKVQSVQQAWLLPLPSAALSKCLLTEMLRLSVLLFFDFFLPSWLRPPLSSSASHHRYISWNNFKPCWSFFNILLSGPDPTSSPTNDRTLLILWLATKLRSHCRCCNTSGFRDFLKHFIVIFPALSLFRCRLSAVLPNPPCAFWSPMVASCWQIKIDCC